MPGPSRPAAAERTGFPVPRHWPTRCARPLIRNSVAPAITVIALSRHQLGDDPGDRRDQRDAWLRACRCCRPARSARRSCPAWRMRWRAPSTNGARSVPCMRRTDRNSSCAAIQSGTYNSASGLARLATRSSVARTCKRFDIAGRPGLNDRPGRGSFHRRCCRRRTTCGASNVPSVTSCRAHAQVLLDARADRHFAAVSCPRHPHRPAPASCP